MDSRPRKTANIFDTANAIHPRIKLTLRYSEESIEFLDVITSIKDGFIKTDLYTKDTDKHQYLQINSNHPRKIKEAIPYGLGIRLKRICSEPDDYEKRRRELKTHLRKRGYKDNLVERQLGKVDNLRRENLLDYNSQKETDRVPLVLTYTDALPNIHSILNRHMKTLYKSEINEEIFRHPPLVAFRRDRNIKDILVHKKHNNTFYKKENGCRFCGQNCALCKHLIETDTFFGTDGKEYKIKGQINCKTVGIIYSIFCKKCQKVNYVGQTGDTFYQRMLLDFSMIRTKKTETVAKHFYTEGHSLEDFSVTGIEKVYGDETYRKVRESFWIKKLRTLSPDGLNRQIDLQ